MKWLAQGRVSIALRLAEEPAVNVNISAAQSLPRGPTVTLLKLQIFEAEHVTALAGWGPVARADWLNVRLLFFCSALLIRQKAAANGNASAS